MDALEKAQQERLAKEKKFELLVELTCRRCLRSFYDFFVEFWDTTSSEKLIEGWYLKYICDELQKVGERIIRREKNDYDLIINIPSGLSKSTMVSIMWPVWMWLHRPDIVIISSSYSGILSIDHSLKSKAVFKSEKFQLYFAHHFITTFGQNCWLIKDTEKDWRNNYGGVRYATSTGGTVTGKHADVIIRDDPLNPEQAESDAVRFVCHRYNDRTLSSRKKHKDKTPTVTVMQRLHQDDSTGHDLMKKGRENKLICLPAELTEDVSPPELKKMYVDGLLDPVRLSREILAQEKITLGSYGYAGQMLQTPMLEGGNIFKKNWFGKFEMMELMAMAERNLEELVWHFVVDTAFTEKSSNDPTGLIAYTWFNNDAWVREYAEVWLEMPKLIEYCKMFAVRNGYTDASTFRVEPKASGLSLIQMMRQQTGLNVAASIPPTKDKVTRANLVAPMVEAGRVHLLNGAGWYEDFIYSVTAFPRAKHDEAVDCLYMMLHGRWKENDTEILDYRSINL